MVLSGYLVGEVADGDFLLGVDPGLGDDGDFLYSVSGPYFIACVRVAAIVNKSCIVSICLRVDVVSIF